MISKRVPTRFYRSSHLPFSWALAASSLFFVASLCLAQSPVAPKRAEALSPSAASNSQAAPTAPNARAEKSPPNEKAKADAAELSTLADQLRDQLNKMNVNVLSLDVLQKTEAIEKLAKKMRGEADVR
jgi:hypothetical protein